MYLCPFLRLVLVKGELKCLERIEHMCFLFKIVPDALLAQFLCETYAPCNTMLYRTGEISCEILERFSL